VGVECLRKEGDRVPKGEPVLRVHSRSAVDAFALAERLFAVE
jgi:thymidine phosphorylase